MAEGKAKMYARVLADTLEGKSEKEIKEIIGRFKQLLKKRGNLRIVCQVEKELKLLGEEKEGKRGYVITATPLSNDARQDMEESLSKKGYQMIEQQEESVIGGTAVVLGNEYLIDGTIRGKLNRIAKFINLKS